MSPQDIGHIAGPFVIGYLLHWGLFGALSVQVYVYHLAFSNDPPKRKILVYGVYAVEFVQTILVTKMAFKELAAGFGNQEALEHIGTLWFAVPILSSTVEFVVQIFYAYRIKLLAESNLIPIVVFLFALIQLGGAIGQGIIASQINDFSKFLVFKTFLVTGIWNAASAICDIIIAISMTYYLSRKRTAFKHTQRIIQKLTRLFIETGIFTATIAIVNLIFFVIPRNRQVATDWNVTLEMIGKIYSTTLMVLLNSRIVFHIEDDYIMGVSRRPALALQSGILVTREQRTVPLDFYRMHRTDKELAADSHSMHAATEV